MFKTEYQKGVKRVENISFKYYYKHKYAGSIIIPLI